MGVGALFADEEAVGPVIGVILMMAIAVILAAVIDAFALGFSDIDPTCRSQGLKMYTDPVGLGRPFLSATHRLPRMRASHALSAGGKPTTILGPGREWPPMRDQQFVESDWEYAIVLDACRYDVFADVYDEYLDGTLEKRRSLGSSTPEWATRTLTGALDMTYFSGNPFINSLGIPLNELKWGASCDYEWTATEHLATVVDVWQEGWDDSLGTVPPDSMTESFVEHQETVDDHDRAVLHYMQPHAPFLGHGDGGKLTTIREGIKQQGEQTGGSDDDRSCHR